VAKRQLHVPSTQTENWRSFPVQRDEFHLRQAWQAGASKRGGHSYTGTISVSMWLWRDNATSTSGIRILCALWETICDETELVATKIFHRHSDGLLCVKEGSDGGAVRERTGARGVLFNILPRDIPIRALPEAGECKHYLHHISHGFRLRAAIRWSHRVKEGSHRDAPRRKVEALVVFFNFLPRSISIGALKPPEPLQHPSTPPSTKWSLFFRKQREKTLVSKFLRFWFQN
jgi:hypothetical protein